MAPHDIVDLLHGGRDADLDLALRLAGEAGRLLLSQSVPWTRSDLGVRAKSSATDAVTAMDLASERLIRDGIAQARPDDAVLGEEEGGPETSSDRSWVVDPLDGTVNYLFGLPHWAVSIALLERGVPRLGVVHVPVLRETFVGVAGRGAVLLSGSDPEADVGPDVHRLHAPPPPPLSEALVATGFSYSAQRRAEQGRLLARVLPGVRDIRRLGAAAIDLCHAAAGRVDGFYEAALQTWDTAAGLVVAVEAGLAVVEEELPDVGGSTLIAAHPALLADLRAMLGAAPTVA